MKKTPFRDPRTQMWLMLIVWTLPIFYLGLYVAVTTFPHEYGPYTATLVGFAFLTTLPLVVIDYFDRKRARRPKIERSN